METKTFPVWARIGARADLTKNEIDLLIASPETVFPQLLNENKFTIEDTYFPDESQINEDAFGYDKSPDFELSKPIAIPINYGASFEDAAEKLKEVGIDISDFNLIESLRAYPSHKHPDFSGSYDAEHDILRLSNNNLGGFTYEELADNILLQISDDPEMATGIQILDFQKNLETYRETLNEMPYPLIRKAITAFCKHHQLKEI